MLFNEPAPQSNNFDVMWQQWLARSGIIERIGVVGSVREFAFSTPPTGWLVCDGSSVNRTTYSELFNAIGTAFGGGNGTTTFNIPDLSTHGIVGFTYCIYTGV